jgi:hypothetical protein
MRQTISGLVAAIAVVTASVAPAMACGGVGGCYAPAPVYSACNSGCWPHERLPDPVLQYGAVPYAGPQYYYVNQGPTFTGPGNWAPLPYYQEGGYRRHSYYAPRHYRHHQPVLRRYY